MSKDKQRQEDASEVQQEPIEPLKVEDDLTAEAGEGGKRYMPYELLRLHLSPLADKACRQSSCPSLKKHPSLKPASLGPRIQRQRQQSMFLSYRMCVLILLLW